MTFEWPLMLLALLLLPLLVLAYVWVQQRRQRYAVRFTNLELLATVMPKRPGVRRHVPAVLTLLALTTLIVALARPHASIAVPRERATVMLVMDASASMQAADVAPTRIDVARRAGLRFVDRLPEGVRLGFVAFDNRPELISSPARVRQPVRDALTALQTGGGTAAGDALSAALEAIRRDDAGGPSRPPGAIVLLSDGKTTAGRNPVEVAAEARRLGVPIHTVSLGTDGGTIELADPALGGAPRTVAVPPDRETMREVARVSGGRAFDALDDEQLETVYDQLGSRVGTERERREVTAGFAAGGAVLLLVGAALSMFWFGRVP